jgi:hypothetical protein
MGNFQLEVLAQCEAISAGFAYCFDAGFAGKAKTRLAAAKLFFDVTTKALG